MFRHCSDIKNEVTASDIDEKEIEGELAGERG
jgi:hypothetical protein